MRKGQKRGEGRGAGAFNGPDPKLQLKIDTVLRDRIVQRATELGVSIPEYLRHIILKDLEVTS